MALALVLAAGCGQRSTRTAGSFDWPCWRGADGNGISRETDWDPQALAPVPRIAWKVDVGMGYSNAVIQAGRLYITGQTSNPMENVVWCLDAASGKVLWRHALEHGEIPQATPAVVGSELYIVSVEGLLQRLDTKNGRVRWQRNLVADCGAVKPTYGFAGSPLVVGSLVILTANSSGMAFDRTTGSLVWGSDPPPGEFPLPTRAIARVRTIRRRSRISVTA